MIIAGIVLFNPELDRLRDNISAIINQVDKIVLVDNGSIEKGYLASANEKIDYIANNENLGIAVALNQIGNYARENNAEWFITLDQDTVCMTELVARYLDYEQYTNIGMMSCIIEDRNLETDKVRMEETYEEITYCITSGSFVNTAAFLYVGGFDEEMFIDKVDFSFCLTLKEKGYKIIRINYVGLLHEVGHSEEVFLLGRKYQIYNHKAFRRYYMSRNAVYIARKHKSLIFSKEILKEAQRMLLVFIFEDEKRSKLLYSIKGIKDGLRRSEK